MAGGPSRRSPCTPATRWGSPVCCSVCSRSWASGTRSAPLPLRRTSTELAGGRLSGETADPLRLARTTYRAERCVRLADAPSFDGSTTSQSESRGLMTDESRGGVAAVDLYWIPLGAGDQIVRVSGKLYEALTAALERRPRLDLYHSALQITLPDNRFIIESAPIPNVRGHERGVVAEGEVGMHWLGRFRLFRYEIRSWRKGSIPDLSHVVSSPVRVAGDVEHAKRVLELAPR